MTSGEGPTIKGTVDIDTAGADEGAQKFAEDAKSVEASANGMSEGLAASGAGFDKMNEGVKSTEEGLQNAGQGLQSVGQESEKTGTSVAAVGRSSEESGRGFMSMANEAMQVAQNIQQLVQIVVQVIGALDKSVEAAQHTQTAFATLTGSAGAAGQALTNLQNTAAAKAYGTQQIDDAAQHLLMMGKDADSAQKEVQRLADGFASVGSDAKNMIPVENELENISKKTKVTAQDMQQLVDQGLPAWQALAAGMGTSVDEAMKKVNAGAVTGKQAMDDIMKGLDKQAGASDKAAQDLSAQWRKFGEEASQACAPLIQDLADIVRGLNDFMEAGKKVEQTLKDMEDQSKALAVVLETIKAILDQIAPGGGSLIPSSLGHAEGIIDSPDTHIATVGENGPETMIIPKGASIIPNGASSGGSAFSSLSSGGGGSITLNVNSYLNNQLVARTIIPDIAPQIRAATGRRA